MSKKNRNDADKPLKILAYIAAILRIAAALVSIVKNVKNLMD